jgi:hypothetical protein
MFERIAGRRRISYALLAAAGFILSPLSWWNDLLVNVPLAYLFAVPFSFADERLFLPAFVLGYWLTNILGFVLLHLGAGRVFKPDRPVDLRRDLLISVGYTLLIVLLVAGGLLPDPAVWLSR